VFINETAFLSGAQRCTRIGGCLAALRAFRCGIGRSFSSSSRLGYASFGMETMVAPDLSATIKLHAMSDMKCNQLKLLPFFSTLPA
jgi:hypothetical protein